MEKSKSLFWDIEYWKVQKNNPFIISDNNLSIFWNKKDKNLLSGFVGYFGGITPDNKMNSFNEIHLRKIFESSYDLAFENSIELALMRMPPIGYYPEYDNVIYSIIHQHEWKTIYSDVISFRTLDTLEYNDLHKNRKYDYDWWVKKDIHTSSGVFNLDDTFSIIEKNFFTHNRELNLDLKFLELLAKKLNDRINFHLVKFENYTVCAAITLKISENVLHIYKWANNPVTEKMYPSALSLLYMQIVEYAVNSQFSILCLGASSSEGNVNSGLLQFKNSLGFKNTERITFAKRFNRTT